VNTSAAIVVTHNRLFLLKENLAALRAQLRRPDEIIVVNNASTDGTADWLKTQSGLTVVTQENFGSSGGQLAGIRTAYARGHDWFWCMDDDVIPKPDALEQLLACAKASDERTGFLCSVVRWTDGSMNLMTAPNVFSGSASETLPENLVRVVSASFVSVMFHRRAVAKKGLPLREMFLWFDDAEYTRRIANEFPSYQVLTSEVEHRTKTNYWVDFDHMAGLPPMPLSYGVRNFIFLRKREAPTKINGWFRCLKSALKMQWRVCRQFSGEQRRTLTRAVWRGIFFNPKIEMPE